MLLLVQVRPAWSWQGPGQPPSPASNPFMGPSPALPDGLDDGAVAVMPAPATRMPGTEPGAPIPGLPAQRRPIPGSLFDPGASGPGIGNTGREKFLGGALDRTSGWPFVFLDHFAPRPQRMAQLWIVQTRDCPQEMGTDPWPCLKILRFDERGRVIQCDPMDLFAQTVGRPVLIQVQGSLTTPDIALGGLLWTHSWLTYHRSLPRDVVIIAFDWPSQRIYKNDFRDINEKGRRAYIAGYHLARFVQGFPPGSRLCLLGQSYGGRVVPSALHLLGGGALNSQDRDPDVRLPFVRSDLQVRGVVLGGASDHNWLDPGQRLDRALYGCEAFLNLYNRRDEALFLYPLLVRSGHRHALGKVGLRNSDFARLGPLAARYAEHDMHDRLRGEHTLLDAVADAHIARLISPYVWAPDPGPSAPQPREPAGPPDRDQYRGFWQ